MNNKTIETIHRARKENWERLDLSNQQLDVLPSELFKVATLNYLDISNNKIMKLPAEIGELKNLEYLSLSANNLITLPLQIANLKKMRLLDISRNKFNDIPNGVCALSALVELNAQQNSISRLPKSLADLDNLKILNLKDNPLVIPPEILSKGDSAIIIEYYFSKLINPGLSINEVKVNVVGQGSVGKTSLIQRLMGDNFLHRMEKTDGISTSYIEVDNFQESASNLEQPKNQKIRLTIWDFGGQEIMHATHQFFLSRRSIYLLILDSRLTQEENRVEYWLKIIQSYGDDSPVIVVGNKVDMHPLDIDRTGLYKKYPNIVGITETSAATGVGIDELKTALTEQANKLPHIHDLLPESWFAVKKALENLGHVSNFITYDRYLELCVEHGINDETSQHTLIRFLHDLGVVLHFQDDPRLESLGILNPQWVTHGVYLILNSYSLFQNKGMLTVSMLDEILNTPDYPRGKRLFIVDMMKKFELCYDIETDKTFLVPDLLPKDEPAELRFIGAPAFEYVYPILPSSIITRFIVRMNKKIEGGLVWRTGVILKIGENIALVKADFEDRKISIAIDGLEHTRRDALSAIRYQLDEIHNSIKGLNPQKRIPIPDASNAEPIEYDYLLMLEGNGQENFMVRDGDKLVNVNVSRLLSGIETESARKGKALSQDLSNVTNIYVGGNVQDSTALVDKKHPRSSEQEDSTKEISLLWDSLKNSLENEKLNDFYLQSNKLVLALCDITGIINTNENMGLDKVYGALVDASTLIQQKQVPVIVLGDVQKDLDGIVESTNKVIQRLKHGGGSNIPIVIPFGIFILLDEKVEKREILSRVYLDGALVIDEKIFNKIIRSISPEKALLDEIVLQVGLAKLNPYVFSGPATDQIFYGRDEEQKSVEEKIAISNYAVVANRRMGKTSFLLKVSEKLKMPYKDNVVVYLDLLHVFNYTEFYTQLLNEVSKLNTEAIPSEEQVPTRVALHLEEILRDGRSFGRIIIIMDEVDELLRYDCENKEKLFKTFRSLSQTQNIRFIFSGTTVLIDRLNSPDSPFSNFCKEIVISRLARTPSVSLIVEPMSKLGIVFLDQTKIVQEILTITDQHPTLIQYLCAKLVERAVEEKKKTISSADLKSLLETQSHIDDIFKIIWGNIESEEKMIVYATWGLESFTKKQLIRLLGKRGVTIHDLDNKLRRLQYYSLLKVNKDLYRFSYNAFSRYYESYHSVDELVSELEIDASSYSNSHVKSNYIKTIKNVLTFPKYLGGFILDTFGRHDSATSTKITWGYVIIGVVILVILGSIDVDGVIKMFVDVWRFFLPVK